MNFFTNACELIKIFSKKIYNENLNLIEAVIEYECATIAEKCPKKTFFTLGPNKVFKSIYSLFQFLENFTENIIVDNMLIISEKIFLQYFMGIEFIITVRKINLLALTDWRYK